LQKACKILQNVVQLDYFALPLLLSSAGCVIHQRLPAMADFLNSAIVSDSDSDDGNLEQVVLQKQQAEMELVEQMNEEEVEEYAKEINENMVSFLMSESLNRKEEKVNIADNQVVNDYEEEEDDVENTEEEEEMNGLNLFFGEMEQELSSLLKPSRHQAHAMSPQDKNSNGFSSTRMLDHLVDIPVSPTNEPISSISNMSLSAYDESPNISEQPLSSQHSPTHAILQPKPPSSSRRLFGVAADSYTFLASSLSSYSNELGKHLEQAKVGLRTFNDIDTDAQDVIEQKNVRILYHYIVYHNYNPIYPVCVSS
jgi:hypothetical protein